MLRLPAHWSFPHGFARRLVVGTLLLNGLVVVLAALAIRDGRITHGEHASIAAQNVSLLLERDISAVFNRIDLILRTSVDEVEQQLATGRINESRLNAFLRKQQSPLPEIISLRVTDAQGLVRYGEGVPPGSPVNLGDREHFTRLRDEPQAGLVIARPVQARIGQQWSIPVSRRVNRPDGQFAGIVYANVPVAHFVRMFQALNLGPHGLVSLRTTDNVQMARYPQTQEKGGAIGQIAISNQLRGLLKGQPSSVTYIAPSPVDRLERVFSYRRAAVHPLYVVAGVAVEDYLHTWRQDTALTVGLVLLFSLMTALLAWVTLRAWHRQLAVDAALRENEMRWSLALEGGNYCVWDWDLPSGQVSLSKRGKRMFGFADDEISNDIGEWQARLHLDDRARVLADLRSVLRGEALTQPTEYRVRHKDGRWRWILTRGMVASRDRQGRALRMVGTHTDVTERREREEELRLAATVFDIADEAVVITNPTNEIISVNPAFSAITGYAPQEVLGRNPSMLSAKSQPKAFYQALWQSLIETGSWRGEVVNRRKSGEVYIEWLSIKRITDARGQVTHHVAVFSDITTRKVVEKRMQHLALHDVLTDLPNRALLAERLGQAIVHAQRDKSRLGLLYFDLDKFKPVNDNYGHDVGDRLLQAVAQRVRDCVRASDTVARIGGDEFVVLLVPVQEARDVLAVAEKIREALNQPFDVAGHTVEVAASIGVAVYPEHGSDEATLTQCADAAMYEAKRNGRNQVLLYQPGM